MSYLFDDASSERLEYGDQTILDGATTISCFAWVKRDAAPGWCSVISKYEPGNTQGINFYLDFGVPKIFINTSGGSISVGAAGTTTLDGWTAIGFSCDMGASGVTDIWMDGEKQAASGADSSGLSSFPNNGREIYIGGRYFNALYFTGNIAEVSLWTSILTDDDFKRLSAGEAHTNIDSANHVFHAPLLDDDDEDLIPVTATQNGTPVLESSDHPNIVNDVRTTKYMAGGVVFGE